MIVFIYNNFYNLTPWGIFAQIAVKMSAKMRKFSSTCTKLTAQKNFQPIVRKSALYIALWGPYGTKIRKVSHLRSVYRFWSGEKIAIISTRLLGRIIAVPAQCQSWKFTAHHLKWKFHPQTQKRTQTLRMKHQARMHRIVFRILNPP